MTKRLFLSILLPEDVKDLYADLSSSLTAGRKIKRENYHITVLFLGSIEESKIPEIEEMIKGVLKNVDPFTLTPEKIDVFPPAQPNMLWVYYR